VHLITEQLYETENSLLSVILLYVRSKYFAETHYYLPTSGPQTRGIISSMAEHELSLKQSWRAVMQLRIATVGFVFDPGIKEIYVLVREKEKVREQALRYF